MELSALRVIICLNNLTTILPRICHNLTQTLSHRSGTEPGLDGCQGTRRSNSSGTAKGPGHRGRQAIPIPGIWSKAAHEKFIHDGYRVFFCDSRFTGHEFDLFLFPGSVDVLDRIFSSKIKSVSLLRSIGMLGLNGLGPIKAEIAKFAMGR